MSVMVRETSRSLQKASMKTFSTGELLKFIGVLILITRFDFGKRAGLWASKRDSKYIPAAHIGKTGHPRMHFDALLSHFSFSWHPDQTPSEMSSEEYHWMRVDGFIPRINGHRGNYFNPSDLICVDESVPKWYGQSVFWINGVYHSTRQLMGSLRTASKSRTVPTAASAL